MWVQSLGRAVELESFAVRPQIHNSEGTRFLLKPFRELGGVCLSVLRFKYAYYLANFYTKKILSFLSLYFATQRRVLYQMFL
jgi:hypothetical protein